jgi:hypothetical protein
MESGRIISCSARSSGVHLGKSAAERARDRIFSHDHRSMFGEYLRRLATNHGGPEGSRGRNVAAETRLATGIDQALADDLIH